METGSALASPVVIDLGKQRKARVKKLRKGAGALYDDVRTAISSMQETGGLRGDAQVVVVVVSEKKNSKKKKMGLF